MFLLAAFGLKRRCYNSLQWCYLNCYCTETILLQNKWNKFSHIINTLKKKKQWNWFNASAVICTLHNAQKWLVISISWDYQTAVNSKKPLIIDNWSSTATTYSKNYILLKSCIWMGRKEKPGWTAVIWDKVVVLLHVWEWAAQLNCGSWLCNIVCSWTEPLLL